MIDKNLTEEEKMNALNKIAAIHNKVYKKSRFAPEVQS